MSRPGGSFLITKTKILKNILAAPVALLEGVHNNSAFGRIVQLPLPQESSFKVEQHLSLNKDINDDYPNDNNINNGQVEDVVIYQGDMDLAKKQCYMKTNIASSDLATDDIHAVDIITKFPRELYEMNGNVSEDHKNLRIAAKAYLENTYKDEISEIMDPDDNDSGNGGYDNILWDNRQWKFDNYFLKSEQVNMPVHSRDRVIRVGYVVKLKSKNVDDTTNDTLSGTVKKEDMIADDHEKIRFYDNQRVALILPLSKRDPVVTFAFERAPDDLPIRKRISSVVETGFWIGILYSWIQLAFKLCLNPKEFAAHFRADYTEGFAAQIFGKAGNAHTAAAMDVELDYSGLYIYCAVMLLVVMFCWCCLFRVEEVNRHRCAIFLRMKQQKEKLQAKNCCEFCWMGGCCITICSAARDTYVGDERARAQKGFWCRYPLGVLCGLFVSSMICAFILFLTPGNQDVLKLWDGGLAMTEELSSFSYK